MITSTSNPRVKALKLLQKAKERRTQQVFVIEGLKEVEKVVLANYQLESALYCPEIISKDRVENLLGYSDLNDLIDPISLKIYNHLSYRENSGGILVCVKTKKRDLDDLQLSQQPLLLVLESIEKPGNLGALLRTADAAGVDAVIVCDQQTDIYNPNVIRSSIGCVFTVPLVLSDTSTTINWMKVNGIKIFCAALTASKLHYQVDYTVPSAIVMGTEATGLTNEWLSQSDQNVIIPMHGTVDSMNVSTSAAVIIFEAIRQRSI